MKTKFQYLKGVALIGAACLVMASSCGEARFKIKGDIAGADNQPVVLEKSDFHGNWIAIDSTRTSSSGSFSITRPAPAAPEVFRLEMGGRYIYLPIDSIETVTVKSSADNYGSDFTLTGSVKAESMEKFDKEVAALSSSISADSLASFKKGVFTKYLKDAQGSILAYYILTKTVDGKPLFDPADDNDFKFFAAVATGFKEMRPNDPHTLLLEQTALNAMKRRNTNRGSYRQIEAEELSILDISLPDENGKNRKLSDITGHGKPVVVMFSLLTHPDSPAINVDLSKLYNSRSGNVEFYQVSLDPDQYAWREAARNLPWVTVFDADGSYSKAAVQYNVTNLPVYFIYDSKGELKERATSLSELRKLLSSY